LIFDEAEKGFWLGKALTLPFATYLPGSQPGLGTVLKQDLGLAFSGGGISTPLPLEGYLDFGWIGCALYGLLTGVIGGQLTKRYVRQSERFGLLKLSIVGATLSGAAAGLGTTLATFLVPQMLIVSFALYLLRRTSEARLCSAEPRRRRRTAGKSVTRRIDRPVA